MSSNLTSASDAVSFVVWLICNVLLIWLMRRISRRLFPADSWSDQLLHVPVLFVSAIIALVTACGACGCLSGLNVLLLACACSALGHVAVSLQGKPADVSGEGGLTAPARQGERPAGRFWVCLWSVTAAITAANVVLNGLLRFPQDLDCLMYHMPLIDFWLQRGSLYAPDFGANWFLAANNELVGLWMVAPFSGDFFIGLNNAPIVLLYASAFFRVCRQLGLPGRWAHTTTLLTLLVPVLGQQTVNASNDLAVAAFFAAALSYFLRYLRRPGWPSLASCAVCTGVLAGVKYYALGYAVMLASVFVAGLWLERGVRGSLRPAASMAALAVAFGGYWYLRNWALTGAPLYPVGFKGPVRELGYPSVWRSTLLGNGDPDTLVYCFRSLRKTAGPWHASVALLGPLVALIAPVLCRDRRTGHSVVLWGPLLVLGALCVWVVIPFAAEDQPGTLNQLRFTHTPVRYGLCFLHVSSLALAYTVCRGCKRVLAAAPSLGRFEPVALCAALATAAWQATRSVSAEAPRADLLILGTAILLSGVVATYVCRAYGRVAAGMALITACVCASGATQWLSDRWHEGFGRHFDAVYSAAVFDALNRDRSARGVYVLGTQPYAFFGSRRRHHVISPRLAPDERELRSRVMDDRLISMVAVERDEPADVNHYGRALPVVQDLSRRLGGQLSVSPVWVVFQFKRHPPR